MDKTENLLNELVPRVNSYSQIWRWFGFPKSQMIQTDPLCKICLKTVASKSSSTSNMTHHLQSHHPEQFTEFLLLKSSDSRSFKKYKEREEIEEEKKGAIGVFTRSQLKEEVLNKILANYLVRDMVPAHAVERAGFKQLISTLSPGTCFPKTSTIKKTLIPQLIESEQQKLREDLEKISYFSVTLESWTCRTSHPYISMVIHYVDDDWKMQAKCLQTFYCPEDLTPNLLFFFIHETLEFWGLSQKQMVSITSNSQIRLPQGGSFPNLHCFQHNLQKAIGNSLEHPLIQRAVSVSKCLIAVISNNTRLRNLLIQTQEEMGLHGNSLIIESRNRWTSKIKMIHRLLEQKNAIWSLLRSEEELKVLLPSGEDMEILGELDKALWPLIELMEALDGEQIFTASYVKPLIQLIKSQVLCPSNEDSSFSKKLKIKIIEYLENFYKEEEVEKLLRLSSTLDPRFKNRFNQDGKMFFFLLNYIHQSDTDTNNEESLETNDYIETKDEVLTEEVSIKRKSLGSFFKKPHDPLEGKNFNASETQEVERYILLPELDSELNPFLWWKNQEKFFPKISKLSKKLFSISGSTVSETNISSCRNIFTHELPVLKPDAVDRLFFLSYNTK